MSDSPKPKEKESLVRKVQLAMSVTGSGDEQLNALVNALARATLANHVKTESVIKHYCDCVLDLASLYESETEGDEYDE